MRTAEAAVRAYLPDLLKFLEGPMSGEQSRLREWAEKIVCDIDEHGLGSIEGTAINVVVPLLAALVEEVRAEADPGLRAAYQAALDRATDAETARDEYLASLHHLAGLAATLEPDLATGDTDGGKCAGLIEATLREQRETIEADWKLREAEERAERIASQANETCARLGKLYEVTEAQVSSLKAERDEKQRWIDEAVRLCGERDCLMRDRRLAEAQHRIETLMRAAGLNGVTEAICEMAAVEGMPDEVVIPVWPRDTSLGPQLTVGAVRALEAALSAQGTEPKPEPGERCPRVETAGAPCPKCAAQAPEKA